MTAEKQKNNNNKDNVAGKVGEASKKTDVAAPEPEQRPKKVAISFKKKIDIKSKLSGTGTPLQGTSPEASPRRLQPLVRYIRVFRVVLECLVSKGLS